MPTSAVVGDTFAVDIRVARARNLFGISGRLQLDRTGGLRLVGISCRDADGSPMDLGDDVICFESIDPHTRSLDFAVTRKRGALGRSGDLRVARVLLTFDEATELATCSYAFLTEATVIDPLGSPLCVDVPFVILQNTCARSPCRVWPGDTNRDGVVNEVDLTILAGFWGQSGAARRDVDGGCRWQDLDVGCWSNADAAYSDGFGDGRVGAEDVLCVGLNWGRTHPQSGPVVALPENIDRDELRLAYAQMLRYLESASGSDDDLSEARRALDALVHESHIPRATAVMQNVPNPFNPSTRIRFDLVTDARVKLQVFDVLGRVVATLVDEDVRAGRHDATWDGTNGAGERVASGIYIYRARLGERSFARKMVLAR